MATFSNTEQTYSTSGVSANWTMTNTAYSLSRNSGGQVNIAGPVLVKAIYAQPVSGFTGSATSGSLLIACDCISGALSGGNVAGNILYHHYGGGLNVSGVGGQTQPIQLPTIEYIARSGLSTWVTNSGGAYTHSLTVLYAGKQF